MSQHHWSDSAVFALVLRSVVSSLRDTGSVRPDALIGSTIFHTSRPCRDELVVSFLSGTHLTLLE